MRRRRAIRRRARSRPRRPCPGTANLAMADTVPSASRSPLSTSPRRMSTQSRRCRTGSHTGPSARSYAAARCRDRLEDAHGFRPRFAGSLGLRMRVAAARRPFLIRCAHNVSSVQRRFRKLESRCRPSSAVPSGTGDDRNAYIHRAWMRRGLPDERLRRHEAADRDREHRVRPDAVQHAPRTRSPTASSRACGRRAACRYNLPVVSLGETQVRADRDAVAQHGRDGDGGDVPRQPDRRRRAARRMRQDDPGAAHGRGIRRPARRRRARRADADRHFRGEALGCGTDVWRLSEEVRAGTLSERAVPEVRVVDDPQQGPLQHDGHRVDDGRRRRGARHDDPGLRRNARRRQPPARARRTRPAGSSSTWSTPTASPATS